MLADFTIGLFRSIQICAVIAAGASVLTVLFAAFAVPCAGVAILCQVPVSIAKSYKRGKHGNA